jgi:hypothetical protein
MQWEQVAHVWRRLRVLFFSRLLWAGLPWHVKASATAVPTQI